MPRMIDLVRSSAVPANLMQAAARGALSVPPAEMIEILVHLANHNKVFGQLARMTLAGWDEKSSLAAAANPAAPREVLDYYIAPENLRPKLLPVLLENPSIPEEALLSLAASGTREVVEAMLKSARIQEPLPILNALASNPNLTPSESGDLHRRLQASGFESTGSNGGGPTSHSAQKPEEGQADESDNVLAAYLVEHDSENAAEAEKPFQPIGGFYEELEILESEPSAVEAGATETATLEVSPAEPAPVENETAHLV